VPRLGLTWATRDDWLRFYRMTLPDGTVVTYGDGRHWSIDNPENEVHIRADALKALGMQATQRIVILGCGPGAFLVEALKVRGLPNCWGVDSSPWVEGRKAVASEGVVWVSADFTGNIANALRQATGDRGFDWIVTESVLESYNDNEIQVGLNSCEGLRMSPQVPMSQIVHLVFTPPFDEPGLFNEKTMAQWKAMRPEHTWMNALGYQVQV
jgi:hypothetical protein